MPRSISVSPECSFGMSANAILLYLLLSLCWDHCLMTFSNTSRVSYWALQNPYQNREYVLSIVWAKYHSDRHSLNAARLYCAFGILMSSGFRCSCDGKNRNQQFSRASIATMRNNLLIPMMKHIKNYTLVRSVSMECCFKRPLRLVWKQQLDERLVSGLCLEDDDLDRKLGLNFDTAPVGTLVELRCLVSGYFEAGTLPNNLSSETNSRRASETCVRKWTISLEVSVLPELLSPAKIMHWSSLWSWSHWYAEFETPYLRYYNI